MEGFIALLILSVIALFVRQAASNRKIRKLSADIKSLNTRLRETEIQLHAQSRPAEVARPETPDLRHELPSLVAEPEPETLKHPTPQQEIIPEKKAAEKPGLETPIQREGVRPVEASRTPVISQTKKPTRPVSAPKKRPSRTQSEFWQMIEHRFAENWIGTLGAIALVLGMGFLGVYAAVNLAAIYRFFMLIGVAGILWGGSRFLKTKPKYTSISAYLSSSSAAILLFACLGSGGIPGLQWIFNPLLAYALLFAGVLVNLFLGYVGKNQVFAALHVILSLVALGTAQLYAAPDDLLIFGTGALVAVFGIALTFRHKWQYHLVAIIIAFFLFHVNWYVNATGFGVVELTRLQHIIGIIAVLLVGIFGVFAHYREEYETKKIDLLPFFTHILNWGLILASVIPHTTGSRWKTMLIFCGGIGLFWLARKAREMMIPWLYRTDTLVSVLLCTVAIATLFNWEWTGLPISALVVGLAVVFMMVMEWEKEELLYKAGAVLLHGALFAVAFFGVNATFTPDGASIGEAVVVAITGLGAVAFHLFSQYRGKYSDQFFGFSIFENSKSLSLSGWAGAAMVGVVMFMLMPLSWGVLAASGLAIGMIFVHLKFPSKSFRLGIQMAMGTALVLSGGYFFERMGLFGTNRFSLLDIGLLSLPLILIYVFAIITRLEKKNISVASLALGLLIPMVYLLFWDEGVNSGIFIIAGLMVGFIFLGRKYIPPRFDLVTQIGIVLILLITIRLVLNDLKFDFLPKVWSSFIPIASFWVIMMAYLLLEPKSKTRRNNLLAGIWIAISSFSYIAVHTFDYMTSVADGIHLPIYLIFLPTIGLLFLQKKPGFEKVRAGAILLTTGLAIINWIVLMEGNNVGLQAIANGIPLLLIGIFASTYAQRSFTDKVFPRAGIYLTAIQLGVMAFAVLEPIHPILTGVAWLTLSLAALGLAQYLGHRYGEQVGGKGQQDRYLLHAGYGFLAIYMLHHIQSYFFTETEFLGIPVRWLAAGLSLAVLGIWILVRKPEKQPLYNSWKWLQPFMVEVALAWLLVTLSTEIIAKEWLPGAWIVVAGACLLIGNLRPERFSRLRLYALLLSILAALGVVGASAMKIRVATPMDSSTWLALALGIVLLFGFVYAFYYKGNIQKLAFPKVLEWVPPLVSGLDKWRNYLLLYPTLIATAVFLYCGFEQQVLTLFWMVECFVIFSLSILLRDQFFRYTAMACVAVCMIRLPFFDLRHAGTLERALSLVGVGIILMVMDYIYKRYKHRFLTPDSDSVDS